MNPTETTAHPATGIECRRIDGHDLPVRAHLAAFRSSTGATELHISIEPLAMASVDDQLRQLAEAYRIVLAAAGTDATSAVFRRLFCSDPTNQVETLAASPLAQPGHRAEACAISIVGQAPVPPARVALWAYHLHDPAGPLDKRSADTTLSVRRGQLTHHWSTGLTGPQATDSADQTHAILEGYARDLAARGMTLADHVLRTWFFVRDIDANYAGLVQARRGLFTEHGLTAQSHYIASSGIGGTSPDTAATVAMEAWAVDGLQPLHVRYLKALDRLSPTNIYGVTFERATAVNYHDRRHVIISGTASIDDQGRIVHPGNVHRQLDRTLENIEALLNEGGASSADMASWIVYLRDIADFAAIEPRLRKRFGPAPLVVVHAPVCRPGWLIELEGLAVLPADHPDAPAY